MNANAARTRRRAAATSKLCRTCGQTKALCCVDWYHVTRVRQSGTVYIEWDALCKPCRRVVNANRKRTERRAQRATHWPSRRAS